MFGALRYVLAGLVVVTHLGPPACRHLGYYAVVGFFTLSGYILSAAYDRQYRATPRGYPRYLLNRLLRVLPTYWVALLAAIVAVRAFPEAARLVHPLCALPRTPGDWLGNLLVLGPGTFTGALPESLLIPPAWSLGVELVYWPLLPIVLRRRALLSVWVVGAAALTTLAYARQLPLQVRYFSVLSGALPFALGALIHQRGVPSRLSRGARRVALAAAVGYYAASTLLFPDPFHWGLLGAVLVNAAVVAACAGVRVTRFATLDAALGELSYPIFLLHVAAGIVVSATAFGPAKFRSIGFLLASFVVTNLGAVLLRWALETPVQRLRLSVRGAGPPPETAPAESP